MFRSGHKTLLKAIITVTVSAGFHCKEQSNEM